MKKCTIGVIILLLPLLFGGMTMFADTTSDIIRTEKSYDKLQKLVGTRIIRAIEESTVIQAYRISSDKDTTADMGTIAGYPIREEGPVLIFNQEIMLKNLLLDDKSYDFERAKKGFIFPTYAFQFAYRFTTVYVLIDFSRKEILFTLRNREYKEDCDAIVPELKQILAQLFPEGE